MHPYVHCSLIYSSQDMEATKCPLMDKWMKKICCIYTMEYYSAIKKNEILPLVRTWMNLEGIMLSETSQTEKDKYCIISIIYGI